MHLYYFSPYDIQRPRTNQLSDLRFCEAFVENNFTVTLFVPQVNRKDNLKKEDIFSLCDIKNTFEICYHAKKFKNEDFSKLSFLKMSFINFLQIVKKHKNENSIVISRSEILLLFTLIYKKTFFKRKLKIAIWLHELKFKKIHRFVYKNVDFVLATNSRIINDLKIDFPKIKYEITYNPISENQLNFNITKEEAREKIKYTCKNKLVVYTGKLFINQKEIDYIIQAAKELPEINFIFTGGKAEVLSFYKSLFDKENIKNIMLTGYINDYSQIKFYQKAADLLISYYTHTEHDVNYNLPNKICEYMMSGNPIITPFYEATKDILNDTNAFNVDQEDSVKLANRIKDILNNEIEIQKRSKNAYITVKQISYKNIIHKIIHNFNLEDKY